MDKENQSDQQPECDASTGAASDQTVVNQSAPVATDSADDKSVNITPAWAHLYDMEPHPLAEIFPMPPEKDILVLADDIKQNGQQNPIIRYEGRVLDGRCRQRACKIAGVEPRVVDFEELKSSSSPLEYVISQNLHRRHLTDRQRAFIAADLATRLPKELTKQNPTAANSRRSHSKPSIANAAKMLNTKPRSVEDSQKVQDHGIPALAEMVKSGEVAPSAAAEIVRLSPEQQVEIVAGGKDAIKEKVKEIRGEKKDRRDRKKKEANTKPASTGLSRRVDDNPDPKLQRLVQQGWLAVVGGSELVADAQAILVPLPKKLPPDDDLKRFIKSANELGCGAFVTAGLEHLIGDVQGREHPPDDEVGDSDISKKRGPRKRSPKLAAYEQ